MKEYSKLYNKPLDRHGSAGYLTNWAARLFARAMDRRMKPLGMSSGQMPVFFALSARPALSQKQLAKAAATEQPTMAATLARMERDGLLVKRPNPDDGRSALYSLSPKALERSGEIRAAVEEINAAALSGLEADERAAFLAMMAKVVGTLETSLSAQD
jgi:MarR family transcriptional regulator, transcriptional regulator for hemolysin